jgi:folate-binding protein YgfZ
VTQTAQVEIKNSPLDAVHKSLGAVMAERDGWSVPASYGDELLEYAAVRESGAGLIDLSSRGRLLVTGSEAVQFLNGLITNDMKTLAENTAMPAIFPNVQGRLLASVRVIRLADETTEKAPVPAFVLDTEAATHERVLKTIEKFTFAGDFHVTDQTATTAMISLQGKAASENLATVLGETVAAMKGGSVLQTNLSDDALIVVRAAPTGEDSFDLIIGAAQAASLWSSLVAAGARPVGYDALEILRIEAGVPGYGKDMDETTVVTETNLDDAVSYTKGCYIGQEIIARIKYRGHVAKKLRGLVFDQFSKIDAPSPIRSVDDKEIGQITSTVFSPHVGQRLALGYVKYDYITSGTVVKAADGSMGHVVELPFVHPGWQLPVEV